MQKKVFITIIIIIKITLPGLSDPLSLFFAKCVGGWKVLLSIFSSVNFR